MAIQNRYDFVLFFDVKDGNPNGDPDSGNLPRIDHQTFHGLVTDGCLKRKVRDYIVAAKAKSEEEAEAGFEIYFQTKGGKNKRVLNLQNEKAFEALNLKSKDKKHEDQTKAQRWMCQHFYDVRTFGAVMSTEVNCGQVRGPVQMVFARSVDPILQQEISITRKSVATVKEAENQIKNHGDITGTIGRKSIVPYGLYRTHGFISANEAQSTGFDETDLELFWQSLLNMFDLDRSASRGMMAARRLIVFKHDSKLGNAPAHTLFERVKVSLLSDNDDKAKRFPRDFSDYVIEFDSENLPTGVSVIEKL